MKYTFAVLLIAIFARIIIAGTFPNLAIENDSADYYDIGRSILTFPNLSTIVNPNRTPIYPLFIASIVRITTRGLPEIFSPEFMKGAQMILLAQGALGIIASLFWYNTLLLTGLSKRLALYCYIFSTANIAVIAWERRLMTEGIAISWLLIEMYLFLRLLHGYSRKLLILTVIHSITGFLLRPAFILIPPVLFLSIAALQKNNLIRVKYAILVALFLIIPFSYAIGNRLYHGYNGITYYSDINLLGIIMQAGIPLESGARYSEIYNSLRTYKAGGGNPYVFDFIIFYDRMIFINMSKMSELQHFAQTVLKHNPIRYLVSSLSAIPKTFSYHFLFDLPTEANPITKKIFILLEIIYDNTVTLTVMIFPFYVYLLWTKKWKRSVTGRSLVIIGVIAMTQSFLTAFFVYEADPLFKRMMAPVQYLLGAFIFIFFYWLTTQKAHHLTRIKRQLSKKNSSSSLS